jgi:hypothetical protein
MMVMSDVWTKIKDAPGYEVSKFGTVRNSRTGRVLRPHLNRPGGYERVNINGKHRYIHKLMIENIYDHDLKENEMIRHRDENKQNNSPQNLKIVVKNAKN